MLNFNGRSLLLYAVTDSGALHGRTLADAVRDAVRGGVTMVQLREKGIDFDNYVAKAKEIKKITDEFHIPFVINDNVEVAIASGADGVHVGQSDMAASDVRAMLKKGQILGVTARNTEQALAAEKMGADYIGSGAVFSTSTKSDAKNLPHSVLKEICQTVSIPVVAIGGITEDNILELKGCGMYGVAVVSAIFGRQNISEAASILRGLSEEISEISQ